MKKVVIAIVLMLVMPWCGAQNLVINNVNVVSPEMGGVQDNMFVHVSNGHITRVSKTPFEVRTGDIVIDGSMKFLIPGLMDSHVHISTMPGETGYSAEMLALKAQYFKQQPRSYLYFGVTQILDPSNSKHAIKAFNQQALRPDLFHCGAMPIKKGYPTMWSTEEQTAATFSYLLDENDDQQRVEQQIARMVEDGAICAKVFIEDGFDTKTGWPLISEQQLGWIRQAAKTRNLPVFAHANALDMQQIAVNAKMDVIAHGMWNWNQYHGQPGLPATVQSVLDKVIKQGVVYQATFNVMDGIKGVLVPDVLDNPLYRKVIPKAVYQWYHTDAGRWFAREMHAEFGGGNLQAIFETQDRVINQGERVLQYLYQQGHTMVLASDTPSSPTFAAQPGFSTFAEIKHMAKVGIALPDILAAATVNNARSFQLEHLYGTVEAGKIANLLLLNDNPLLDVEAYNSIDTVILRGQAIERDTLSVQ